MNPPPKLLDEVRRALRVRHRSPRTEEAYFHWIRRFIHFHGRRHPRELGRADVSRFLSHLAVEHDVSRGGGYVQLPDALARKLPSAQRDLRWQWLFAHTCIAKAAKSVAITSTKPSSNARSPTPRAAPESASA